MLKRKAEGVPNGIEKSQRKGKGEKGRAGHRFVKGKQGGQTPSKRASQP